jgi:hypothetical protein
MLSRLTLCVVTGHDDPFGDWSACTSPGAKATPEEGVWSRAFFATAAIMDGSFGKRFV